jgi:phosphatidylglycerophosphate synthase
VASATLAELRAVTYKKRDSWWTVLLVDPLAIHLVRLADRLRWVTPNRITLLAFLLGFGVAGCFLAADPVWLVTGAVLYHVTFILDCVDGKLARWQQSGSVVGGWLDFTLDQVRLVICAIALLSGQYLATGRGVFLLLAAVVVFLNMFRYFNGFVMERALYDLRDRLAPGPGGQRRAPSIGDDDPVDDEDNRPRVGLSPSEPTDNVLGLDDVIGAGGGIGGAEGGGAADIAVADPPDLKQALAAGPPSNRSRTGRLRTWLTARRIRLNVYSGIEFQMVVLIGAPLAGAGAGGAAAGTAVLTVTVAACLVMVAFELAQTARFLGSAGKLLRAIEVRTTQADPLPDSEVPVQRPRTGQ